MDQLWSVIRQDDNGRIYVVSRGLAEDAARELATTYQRRGHKQLYASEPSGEQVPLGYWVEPDEFTARMGL